jgi:hypothetical protein
MGVFHIAVAGNTYKQNKKLYKTGHTILVIVHTGQWTQERTQT